MLKDIVVDTNVFVHESNPGVTYHTQSKKLVNTLWGVPTSLCIDEGFHVEPALNRSLIGHEYLNNIPIGSLAYALISQLANTGRMKTVSRCVAPVVGRKVNQKIAERRDRTFLKVAINSQDHFLCSHDFRHFSNSKRAEVKKLFDVRVKAAGETLLFLG